MEKLKRVKAYRVELFCDSCKKGFMKCTGSGITTWETAWEHRCNNCKNISHHNKSYPYIKHVTCLSFIEKIKSILK